VGWQAEAPAPQALDRVVRACWEKDPLFPNLGLSYSVSADGQQVPIHAVRNESRNPPITVITNWTAGLKQ
jgi:hypothetical protein